MILLSKENGILGILSFFISLKNGVYRKLSIFLTEISKFFFIFLSGVLFEIRLKLHHEKKKFRFLEFLQFIHGSRKSFTERTYSKKVFFDSFLELFFWKCCRKYLYKFLNVSFGFRDPRLAPCGISNTNTANFSETYLFKIIAKFGAVLYLYSKCCFLLSVSTISAKYVFEREKLRFTPCLFLKISLWQEIASMKLEFFESCGNFEFFRRSVTSVIFLKAPKSNQ